jgi:peptidoglycan hydrolase-like protein with peptidoglycan-binding domain
MKRLLCLVFTLCMVDLAHADQTIRSLQQTLKEQGFYYGTVTGEKNEETTSAIRRYQIRKGLKITGEMNEETSNSLSASASSVATVGRAASKPAVSQPNSVRSDVTSTSSHTSARSIFQQQPRWLETNPSYSTSFYQSTPPRTNRRTIAGAQYQLMRSGYYRGRIDGNYGAETAFALRAFQSNAGLVPTGRLDRQTVDALGLSDPDLTDAAPATRLNPTGVPQAKFENVIPNSKYHRPWGGEHGDDRQASTSHGWNVYNEGY